PTTHQLSLCCAGDKIHHDVTGRRHAARPPGTERRLAGLRTVEDQRSRPDLSGSASLRRIARIDGQPCCHRVAAGRDRTGPAAIGGVADQARGCGSSATGARVARRDHAGVGPWPDDRLWLFRWWRRGGSGADELWVGDPSGSRIPRVGLLVGVAAAQCGVGGRLDSSWWWRDEDRTVEWDRAETAVTAAASR